MNQPEFTHSYVHNLIEEEFRPALTSSEYDVSTETDGVVVLSAYEFIAPPEGSPLSQYLPENAENLARIEMGAAIVHDIAAQKAGKPPDRLSIDDFQRFAPTLVLNGTTTQLPHMEQLIEQFGFPAQQVSLVDCGPMGRANTKTQMEAMLPYIVENSPRHLTFVTSDYHLPRVARTVDKQLSSLVDFQVIQGPHDRLPAYDVAGVVKGEVRRIGAYATKGDISWHVR